MPTYEALSQFWKDWDKLSREQQQAFRVAIEKFVADLKRDHGFRPGLRVKGVQGAEGIYEMTWARDGRATFQYGAAQRSGESHIVWRRVGTHDILACP